MIGERIEWNGLAARYLPHERRFMRQLADSDAPTKANELAVIHTLKAEFPGSVLVPADDDEREGRDVETQLALPQP